MSCQGGEGWKRHFPQTRTTLSTIGLSDILPVSCLGSERTGYRMRWLLYGLLISVGALLVVAVAAVLHVRKQRRLRPDEPTEPGLSTRRVRAEEKPVAAPESPPGTNTKEEA
jgi:hypothetical protein